MRIGIAQAETRRMAQTVNRDLVRWFVAMNFGPRTLYPRVEWPICESEDMTAVSAVATPVPLRLKVSRREMRDRLRPERELEIRDHERIFGISYAQVLCPPTEAGREAIRAARASGPDPIRLDRPDE